MTRQWRTDDSNTHISDPVNNLPKLYVHFDSVPRMVYLNNEIRVWAPNIDKAKEFAENISEIISNPSFSLT